MDKPKITIRIEKLVAITKNKVINTILVTFFLLLIPIIAYVDLNYPKHISKQVAIPIFIVMAMVMLTYVYIFVSIRVLTNKEEKELMKYFKKNLSKDSKLPKNKNQK